MPTSPKVKIVTLGCAKNDVDSEEIAGVLSKAGYAIAADGDITIINTCGFLESAKKESIEAIREAVRAKHAGKTKQVIVAGCLAQRLGAELAELAPGADAYVGVGQMGRFDEIVLGTPSFISRQRSGIQDGAHVGNGGGGRGVEVRSGPLIDIAPPHHRWADVGTRARAGKPWSAYLKVSEGCDHKCTFCTIPSFRGAHVSKPLERVLAEANHLASAGCKEINLIAQDVTQYGYDLYREFTLPKLLRELNAIEGLEWIRILYFYPNRLTDEVIETMASCEKVAKYIDIPLQHTHPDTLRRMKRPWDGDRYLKLMEKVRSAMPTVAIRTTFIVGFPGETDTEFEHMIDFVKAARLDRVGAFLFSRERGTPSFDMPDQVPSRIKRQRYDRLMREQQQISLAVNEGWVGKKIKVLIEDRLDSPNSLVGRSHRDAPDIDGLVFVDGTAQPGSIVEAEVIAAEPYDLYARLANAGPVPRRLLKLRQFAPAQPK